MCKRRHQGPYQHQSHQGPHQPRYRQGMCRHRTSGLRNIQISTPRTAPASGLTRNVQTSTPRTSPASRLESNVQTSTPRTVPVSSLITYVQTLTGRVRVSSNRMVLASTFTSTVHGRRPASRRTVETLPRVVISENEGECSICLEEWSDGEMAAELPCEHKYHFRCVKKCLMINSTYPQCRYELHL